MRLERVEKMVKSDDPVEIYNRIVACWVPVGGTIHTAGSVESKMPKKPMHY